MSHESPAVKIIKSEHRSLATVLYTLGALTKEVVKGKTPEYRVFHGMITYIDRFLNTYHHPKEDTYLLPMLKTRAPQHADLVEQIYEEHIQGEFLFCRMIKSLSALEMSGDLAFSGFDQYVAAYTEFEKNHALKEEKTIIPLAQEHLKAEDWQALDAAFTDNADPLFGTEPENKFKALFTEITWQVPKPYGLADSW